MGKLLSKTSRSVKMYNIENRAHKIISEEKPKVAPRHKATLDEIERIKEEYPESYQNLLKKDVQLDKYLKDVFVQSHKRIESSQTATRTLPFERKTPEEPLYGYTETDKFAPGNTSLRLVLNFISDHQKDPKTHNPESIALQNNLTPESVRNILKYFRVFEVYLPEVDQNKPKATFIGPSLPKFKSKTVEKKRLTTGKSADDT